MFSARSLVKDTPTVTGTTNTLTAPGTNASDLDAFAGFNRGRNDVYPVETTPSTEPVSTSEAVPTPEPTAVPTPEPTAVPTPEPTKEETQKAVEIPDTDNVGEVYITNIGAKYHRGSCSSLKKSKIPISLEKAKSDGYGPCARCY